MPDYELKAKILNEFPECVQAIKDSYTYFWAKEHLWFDKNRQSRILDEKRAGMEYASEMFDDTPFFYAECEKIANADKQRRKRLQNRIKIMLQGGQCYFITLTFREDVLTSTDEKTRRRYVHYYLKYISDCYVANIDFGKQNGREHYHAVVRTDSILNEWRYGFYKNEKVCNTDLDSLRLAKYVAKLSNHAIKETTKRNALIYSR